MIQEPNRQPYIPPTINQPTQPTQSSEQVQAPPATPENTQLSPSDTSTVDSNHQQIYQLNGEVNFPDGEQQARPRVPYGGVRRDVVHHFQGGEAFDTLSNEYNYLKSEMARGNRDAIQLAKDTYRRYSDRYDNFYDSESARALRTLFYEEGVSQHLNQSDLEFLLRHTPNTTDLHTIFDQVLGNPEQREMALQALANVGNRTASQVLERVEELDQQLTEAQALIERAQSGESLSAEEVDYLCAILDLCRMKDHTSWPEVTEIPGILANQLASGELPDESRSKIFNSLKRLIPFDSNFNPEGMRESIYEAFNQVLDHIPQDQMSSHRWRTLAESLVNNFTDNDDKNSHLQDALAKIGEHLNESDRDRLIRRAHGELKGDHQFSLERANGIFQSLLPHLDEQDIELMSRIIENDHQDRGRQYGRTGVAVDILAELCKCQELSMEKRQQISASLEGLEGMENTEVLTSARLYLELEALGFQGTTLEILSEQLLNESNANVKSMLENLSPAAINRLNESPEMVEQLLQINQQIQDTYGELGNAQQPQELSQRFLGHMQTYLENPDPNALAETLQDEEMSRIWPTGFTQFISEQIGLGVQVEDDSVELPSQSVAANASDIDPELQEIIDEFSNVLGYIDEDMGEQIRSILSSNPELLQGLADAVGVKKLKDIIKMMKNHKTAMRAAFRAIKTGGVLSARAQSKFNKGVSLALFAYDTTQFLFHANKLFDFSRDIPDDSSVQDVARNVFNPELSQTEVIHHSLQMDKAYASMISDIANLFPGVGQIVSIGIDVAVLSTSAGEAIGEGINDYVGRSEAHDRRAAAYARAHSERRIGNAEYYVRNSSDGRNAATLNQNAQELRALNDAINSSLETGKISQGEAMMLRLAAGLDQNGNIIESEEELKTAIEAARDQIIADSVSDRITDIEFTLLIKGLAEFSTQTGVGIVDWALEQADEMFGDTSDEQVEADLEQLRNAIENETDPLQKMVLEDRLRKVEFWIEHGPPGTFEVNFNNLAKEAWNSTMETGNDIVNTARDVAEDAIEIIEEMLD